MIEQIILLNKDVEFKPFSSINHQLITKDIWKYLSSLEKIVKSHPGKPFKDIVGEVSGYELVELDKEVNAGGWFDRFNKEIAINEEYKDDETIITHELGHFVQLQTVGLYEGDNVYTLSSLIRMEQQAETISYYLHKILFPYVEVPALDFNSYMDIDGVKFLHNWYKDCEKYDNDLLVIKTI